jgi:hypothetical protein
LSELQKGLHHRAGSTAPKQSLVLDFATFSDNVTYMEETRVCQNCKVPFTIDASDFGFYEKIKVPPPTNCANCRQQLRTIFRNFKTLYRRPSDKSGAMLIAGYSPDVPFPIYSVQEWWDDDWDPLAYALDYDAHRPFFEQVKELFNRIPHAAVMNTQCENCEYSNHIDHSRNCYLLFGGLNLEECDYGHIVWNCRDSVDNLYLFKSESCYECIDCLNSARLFYSEECDGCVDGIGLYDCKGCTNCIGCVGQVNKSNCIFNKQVSREEYAQFLLKYPVNKKESIEYILQEREKLRKKIPQRSFFGFRNTNISGNHIYNARNVRHSFDVKSGENSKYCYTVRSASDSYDLSFTGNASESYQSMTLLGSNKVMGSLTIVDSHDILYSEHCYNSHDLIGCYGIRKKSFCILNKQYDPQDYQSLKEKIVKNIKESGIWGNFLPKDISPFAYNEAIVGEYMPLSKEEAIRRGFRWRDNIPEARGQGTVEYGNLPNDPREYDDNLIKEVLTCENCDRNYRLINREINFYKKFGLALPSKCFNCRHALRMSPRQLWSGACANCGKEILTSHPAEKQKIYKIYCERCYQQEVY